MKRTILFIFAIVISSTIIASEKSTVFDRLSNSSEIKSLIGGKFIIHLKYIKTDYSNIIWNYYELKTQMMDSPTYFCSTLKINDSINGEIEVTDTIKCKQ